MAGNSLAQTAYTSDRGDCYLLEHESGLWSESVILPDSFVFLWLNKGHKCSHPSTDITYLWFRASLPTCLHFFLIIYMNRIRDEFKNILNCGTA